MMTGARKKTFVLIYRLLLILIACIGLYDTVFSSGGGFMNAGSLSYYTVQSNILALLITVCAVILSFGKNRLPEFFFILKFVVAVAITVTFLVFWTMLAPAFPGMSIFSISNITLHTLVPLMTLADVMFFDTDSLPTKKQVLFCVLPPLLYFGFAMVRAELSENTFYDGSRYPYWFIDADKLGWFGFENGPGVFYWVIVVIIIVLSLGYLTRFIKKAVMKKKPEFNR